MRFRAEAIFPCRVEVGLGAAVLASNFAIIQMPLTRRGAKGAGAWKGSTCRARKLDMHRLEAKSFCWVK